jgi:uncharacterized protein YlxW (UPF0749 family)
MAKRKLTPEEKERIRLIEKASKSLKDYMELVDEVRDKENNINHIQRKRNELKSELLDLEAQANVLRASGTGLVVQLRLKPN